MPPDWLLIGGPIALVVLAALWAFTGPRKSKPPVIVDEPRPDTSEHDREIAVADAAAVELDEQIETDPLAEVAEERARRWRR